MGFQTGVCLSREAVAGKGTTEETLILALIFSSAFKTKGCLLFKGFSQKKMREIICFFLHIIFFYGMESSTGPLFPLCIFCFLSVRGICFTSNL